MEDISFKVGDLVTPTEEISSRRRGEISPSKVYKVTRVVYRTDDNKYSKTQDVVFFIDDTGAEGGYWNHHLELIDGYCGNALCPDIELDEIHAYQKLVEGS